MQKKALIVLALLLGVGGIPPSGRLPARAPAGGAADEGLRLFEKRVAPLLEARCLGCHSAETRKGKLSLATRRKALEGGRRGRAVVPGDPGESLLMRMVAGDEPRMPKKGPPLRREDVEVLRRWIAAGAPWPDGRVLEDRREESRKARGRWWSFKPLREPAVPRRPSPWARTPIDLFVLEKLREAGLEPSPEADRRTLVRRLFFDLLGLPPPPAEVESFARDPSETAYETLVDRLLASPRHGERWARHWLDVVHYGDTHGFDKDKVRPNAWPYRDYVVRAFNEDRPYARFAGEQLAGDVLYPDDPDGIVATGFIAAGPWDFVGHVELREGTLDKGITRNLDRDDMVSTAMSTFASVTAHCARCHDHKFDPIPQEEYYALQAVFAGVDRADRPYDPDPDVHRRRVRLDAERRALAMEQARLGEVVRRLDDRELREMDARREGLRKELEALSGPGRDVLEAQLAELEEARRRRVDSLVDEETARAMRRVASRLPEVEGEIGALPPSRVVYAAASDFKRQGNFTPPRQPRPIHVLLRGKVRDKGPPAAPGALSCLEGLEHRFEVDGEREAPRRAAFARWLTRPENGLFWRSIVNRVWHFHFGRGIVDSPNDFGRMGVLPTHPELLDWLAVRFRDEGGSLKKLHRLIVTSSVYRQTSAGRDAAAKLDGGNRFLWRMNRRRLEAEAVRDSVLLVSGAIDLKMGGPAVRHFFFKDDHSPVYDYSRFDPRDQSGFRRSVYRLIVRSVPDPFMECLDSADPSILTPKRNVTLTATQALALLNNPFMVEQARRFADRLRREVSGDLSLQVTRAHELALGRLPDREEEAILAAHARRHGLENVCRLLFNANEFIFVD